MSFPVYKDPIDQQTRKTINRALSEKDNYCFLKYDLDKSSMLQFY